MSEVNIKQEFLLRYNIMWALNQYYLNRNCNKRAINDFCRWIFIYVGTGSIPY